MTPLDQLTELFGLDIAGLKVAGAHLYGRGADAAAIIDLSNQETLEFETLRSMARPQTLLAELAAVAGVVPDLKQSACMRAIALVSEIATNEMRLTEANLASEWGADYLQAASLIDVDLRDQADRWGAFSALAKRDPAVAARDENTDLACAGLVLRDITDGARLVRSGWYLAYVRANAPRVSHQRLPALMGQAGWTGPQRIKATCPTRTAQLVWGFYTVPGDWTGDTGQVTR